MGKRHSSKFRRAPHFPFTTDRKETQKTEGWLRVHQGGTVKGSPFILSPLQTWPCDLLWQDKGHVERGQLQAL